MLLPRGKQRSLYDLRVAGAYLAGTSIGATWTVLVLWTLSGFAAPLSPNPRLVLLGAGAVFVWMCKDGPLVAVCSLPEARRQIPAQVFGGSLVRGAFRFGLELGTGVRTYVPSVAPYVLVLTVVLGHLSIGQALLVGLGFGLGRAIPVMVAVGMGERVQAAFEFLRHHDPLAGPTAGIVVLIGGWGLV